MTKGNDFAFTTVYEKSVGSHGRKQQITEGLTKREFFAAMAMMGLLANGDHNNSDMNGIDERASLCAYSTQFADSLIEQLKKQP